MAKGDITLDTFMKREAENFVRFQAWWLSGRTDDRESFPLVMSPSDWIEQYSIWRDEMMNESPAPKQRRAIALARRNEICAGD